MPVIKFESEWLKIGDNIQDGDNIQFLDTGVFDEEKNNYTFSVSVIHDGLPTVIKKFSLNKTNSKAVAALYGDNSDNWIHKEMKVGKYKARNPQTGTMVDAIMLEAPVAK